MSVSREQLEYQARKTDRVPEINSDSVFLPLDLMRGSMYFKYPIHLVIAKLEGSEGGFVTQTYAGDEFIIFVDCGADLVSTLRHELIHIYLAGRPSAIFSYPQSEEQIVTLLTTTNLSLLETDLCDYVTYIVSSLKAAKNEQTGNISLRKVDRSIKERDWYVIPPSVFLTEDVLHPTAVQAAPLLVIQPQAHMTYELFSSIREKYEKQKALRIRKTGRDFSRDLDSILDTGKNFRTQMVSIIIIGFDLETSYQIAREVGLFLDVKTFSHGFIVTPLTPGDALSSNLDLTLAKETYGWRKSIK